MNNNAAPDERSASRTPPWNSRSVSTVPGQCGGRLVHHDPVILEGFSADSALPISMICWSAIDRPRAGPLGVEPRRRARSNSSLDLARASSPRSMRPQRAAAAARPMNDVLRDRQIGEERRLLVDDGDARVARVGRAVEVDRLAVDEHLAAVEADARRASILTSVDLPAPFSPTRACTSPAATSREAPSRACAAPKALAASSSARIGGAPAFVASLTPRRSGRSRPVPPAARSWPSRSSRDAVREHGRDVGQVAQDAAPVGG